MTFNEIGKINKGHKQRQYHDLRIIKSKNQYGDSARLSFSYKFYAALVSDVKEKNYIKFFVPKEAPNRLYFKTIGAKKATYGSGRSLSGTGTESRYMQINGAASLPFVKIAGEYDATFDPQANMYYINTDKPIESEDNK